MSRGGSLGGCAALRPQVLLLHSEAWFSSWRFQPSSPKGTVPGVLGRGSWFPVATCGPGHEPVPSAAVLALSPLCSNAWPGHSQPRRRLSPLNKSNQFTDGLDLFSCQSVLCPCSSICSSGFSPDFPYRLVSLSAGFLRSSFAQERAFQREGTTSSRGELPSGSLDQACI